MKIYTDGAYSQKRDKGGYAFVIQEEGVFTKVYSASLTGATNQRAEVLAVISAFRYLLNHPEIEEVEIITDSMYVVGTSTLGWKIKANQDLWGTYFILYGELKDKIKFTHVRGHRGIEGNELADIHSVIASESLEL